METKLHVTLKDPADCSKVAFHYPFVVFMCFSNSVTAAAEMRRYELHFLLSLSVNEIKTTDGFSGGRAQVAKGSDRSVGHSLPLRS